MTVGKLKTFLHDLDDDMLVVTDEYNSGYGGKFETSARIDTLDEPTKNNGTGQAGDRVVLVTPYWN